MADVGRIVRSAHERWDGTGYPDGLAGEEIPIESRIIFCCDAFNAITTDRSYRSGRSEAWALAEVRANAGTQFDPAAVEALVATVREPQPDASYRRQIYERGSLKTSPRRPDESRGAGA